MVRPRYRLEIQRTPSGKFKYYLAKDVRVGRRKGKVKKYLGMKKPSNQVLGAARLEYAYDLETRAIAKKADLSINDYRPRHLDREQLRELEEMRFTEETLLKYMTKEEKRLFRINLEAHYIHGSLSIDGIEADLGEVERLLRYNERGGMPYNVATIINNLRRMDDFRRKERGVFSVENVRRIHSLLFRGAGMESPGKFRRTDSEMIVGKEYRVSSYRDIESDLQKAIDGYYSGLKEEWHPFELACLFHHSFLRIAPFTDGNGLVAREIMQQMCIAERFPRSVINADQRTDYTNALRKADRGDMSGFMEGMKDIAVQARLEEMKKSLAELLSKGGNEPQRSLEDFS
ncbi:MAG: hypothetical protein PWQ88_1059 [Candidatus Methanomethylophilaceae archaeon]|nr:hypothetical protein [Candidatus Methanomethylophilaceae archaeon]HIJ00375.1 Fic family protein [Candidatus Methanomethylophilaceae archaeon]